MNIGASHPFLCLDRAAYGRIGTAMRNRITVSIETPWYELFSRGARDWLRHNEKVREGVQKSLPNLVAESDIITGSQDRTVHVPVRMLEHARFRLSDGSSQGQPTLRRAERDGYTRTRTHSRRSLSH